MTNESVAAEIDKVATDWDEQHKNSWGPQSKEPDPSMLDAGVEDAADLQKLAKFVRENNLKQAARFGHGLDTIVREELPDSFFRLLEKNNIKWG